MNPPPIEMPAIVLRGLTKEFGTGFWGATRKRVLDNLTFAVNRGTSFGFLGPNGAGKTTTIKALVGLIFPTFGDVFVLGHAPSNRHARQSLGYLPENPSFSDGLTGGEVLHLMAKLTGIPRTRRLEEVRRVLSVVGLRHAENTIVRKYSKGMTQRLGIAQALLDDPDLVILDEPMSGLDPIGRREMKELILNLRNTGKTVFFSTHIISDVEEVCDQLAIIVGGQIVKQGTVAGLIGADAREVEILASAVPVDFPTPCERTGGTARFHVASQSAVRNLLEGLWSRGAEILSVRPLRYGLEDVFIQTISAKGATSGDVQASRDGK